MRRWVRAAMAACLFLVISSICRQGFAREIVGRKFVYAKGEDDQSAVDVNVNAVRLDRCKSKKLDFCKFLNRADMNSTSLDEDDKRVVPTGPNPLHNR